MPREPENFPPDDHEYQTAIVTAVEPQTKGGWAITRDDDFSFFVPADSPVVPTAGMFARFYGRGLGYIVRGLYLNGERVFYRTAAEQAEKNRHESEERDKAKRYDFEKDRAARDKQYAALPEVFRRRLDRFRANNSDFRLEYEPYEVFCCEQAVVIAEGLRLTLLLGTSYAETFDKFKALPWEQQQAMIPGLDDGHSGNTFGCACALAYLYLTDPESVARVHGALSPLVGSEAYGDVPQEEIKA